MSAPSTGRIGLDDTLGCQLKTPRELCRIQTLAQSHDVRTSTRLRLEDYIRRLFTEVFEARIREAELPDVRAIMVCSRLPGEVDAFPVTEVTLDSGTGPAERAYVLLHLAGHLLQSMEKSLVVVEPKLHSRAELMASEAERTDHVAADDVVSVILESHYVNRIWSASDVRDGCFRWTPNHARIALAGYLAGGLPYRPGGLPLVIDRALGRTRTREALTRLRNACYASEPDNVPKWVQVLLRRTKAVLLDLADVLRFREFLWFIDLLDARDRNRAVLEAVRVDRAI